MSRRLIWRTEEIDQNIVNAVIRIREKYYTLLVGTGWKFGPTFGGVFEDTSVNLFE